MYTKDLRITIISHDWNKCIQALQPLLENMSNSGMNLVTHQAILYLTRFSKSDIVLSFSGFLEEFTAATSSESPKSKTPQLPQETQDEDGNRPGFGNFIDAIDHLWQAAEVYEEPQKCSKLLAHTIGQLIIADTCFYWANVHPDEWQLLHMFWSAESDSEGNVILPKSIERSMLDRSVKFRLEPEALGYQAAKWFLIADEIEEQLNK